MTIPLSAEVASRDHCSRDAPQRHVPQGGLGRSKNGLFLEAFPPDVVAFPGAIKAAHDEWKR